MGAALNDVLAILTPLAGPRLAEMPPGASAWDPA